MRITKKMLRGAKHEIQFRIKELCRLLERGGLREEVERCFPGVSIVNGSNSDFMGTLLKDLVERAIPSHWVD